MKMFGAMTVTSIIISRRISSIRAICTKWRRI